jgi:RNA polymerase sigma factor (sigma-70 family)
MSVAVSATASSVRAAEAAALLYEHHSERILAFCVRRLRSREEAEDALQQTFLKAFAAMRGGFRPSVERAWLYRIAENVCADRLRANGRRVRHETKDAEAMLEVLPARDAQPIEGLDQALAALTPQQRQALLLREWQGLSYGEIASELRLSHSAVETLLFRARRSLARKLETLPMIPWLKSTLFGGGAGAKAVATVAATVAVGVGAASVAPIVTDRSPSEGARVAPMDHETPKIAHERASEAQARFPVTTVGRGTKRGVTPTVGPPAVVDTTVEATRQERPPAGSATQQAPARTSPAHAAPPADPAPAATTASVPPILTTPELTAPKAPEAPLDLPVELPPLPAPQLEAPPVELPLPSEPLEPLGPVLEPLQPVLDAAPELPLLP